MNKGIPQSTLELVEKEQRKTVHWNYCGDQKQKYKEKKLLLQPMRNRYFYCTVNERKGAEKYRQVEKSIQR